MKKIFIAVLAVAALASCSKEQTVNVDKGAVIGFDTFVENSTRANDLKKDNFDFGVYGLVEKGGNSALIFDNQEVALFLCLDVIPSKYSRKHDIPRSIFHYLCS